MINETVESKLPTELPLKFGHLEAYLILALRIRHNHAKIDIWPLNQLLLVYQQAVQASLAHSRRTLLPTRFCSVGPVVGLSQAPLSACLS